jgi:rhamnose utilization protein RhaD (predicted bifunctional aldolase and dehydrogenase)
MPGTPYGGRRVKSNAALKPAVSQSEIDALLELSGRLGRNPLLVQASSGNTSLKLDGTLWVKASGTWLAEADRREIFIPVELAECLQSFRRADLVPILNRRPWGSHLRPSVETFMHAALPQRVVVHVHSVNTIAWAVRSDAPTQLAIKLFGLNWSWVPYVGSGFPLAREVHLRSRRNPRCNIFVLGNHGLVICGDDLSSVESLLFEVEQRLALVPRLVPQANLSALEQIRRFPGWSLPGEKSIHVLGTDGNSRRVVEGGVLYPCQALFLGGALPLLSRDAPPSRLQRRIAGLDSSPFLIVERSGVLIREKASPAELAVLQGYVEVVRRIDTAAPIRYLTNMEIKSLLRSAHGRISTEDTHSIPSP